MVEDAIAHPAWTRFLVSVIHLRPIIGVEPPVLHFPDAKYELVVSALDPRPNPTPLDLDSIQPMHPANVVVQFSCKDDHWAQVVAALVVQGILMGVLPVEPEGIAGALEAWHQAVQAIANPGKV